MQTSPFIRFALGLLLTLSAACSEAAAPTGKTLTIAGVVLFEDMFFNAATEGMRAAAKKGGVNLLVGSTHSDLKMESQLIDHYIKLRVDAIVLSPVDANKSVEALRRAHEKGIKIITYNDTLNANFLTTTVSSSQQQLGISTGDAAYQYIEKHLSGKAQVAILAFDSLLPKQSDSRVQGFLNQTAKKLPGVHVVARQDAWMADRAIKVADELIKAHPELDIIFAANEGGTEGATLAVKTAGKAGKIKVFGIDASQQEVNMLLSPDNILQASTGQQSFLMGQEAITAAIKACQGAPVEKTIITPGILLTREQPDVLKQFHLKQLKH